MFGGKIIGVDKSANLFDPVIRSRLAFNFLFDIQFALGVAAGWLMREGYSNAGSALLRTN